ncbi:hypothetical protein F5144DRAFT_232535 [Chaetomium tenue]|uniref:Uncharacterized protein n=1 Tax=Chaetomium tenue TaxID=1854479 RepID=A0ACB7P683_9PEZI|nr:hypothetical protein F5144DRAFT_232535 [Chaetomium globosum]
MSSRSAGKYCEICTAPARRLERRLLPRCILTSCTVRDRIALTIAADQACASFTSLDNGHRPWQGLGVQARCSRALHRTGCLRIGALSSCMGVMSTQELQPGLEAGGACPKDHRARRRYGSFWKGEDTDGILAPRAPSPPAWKPCVWHMWPGAPSGPCLSQAHKVPPEWRPGGAGRWQGIQLSTPANPQQPAPMRGTNGRCGTVLAPRHIR